MLTSRDVGTFHEGFAEVEGITAHCVATVGLSNAESVGKRLPYHAADGGYGTINIGLVTNAPLTEAAQLEALSITVQARTAGVMAAGLTLADRAGHRYRHRLRGACLPAGNARYAGLHTATGEAIGARRPRLPDAGQSGLGRLARRRNRRAGGRDELSPQSSA